MTISITVTCYAGYRGEQEPRSLAMGGNTVAVASITDRWLSPDHRYFKIIAEDGCVYIVRHDMNTHLWELVYYRHPDAREKS